MERELEEVRERLVVAEQRLLEAEHRARLAEALADERGRALEVERALVLMITGQVQHPAHVAPQAPETVPGPAVDQPAPQPASQAVSEARERPGWRDRVRGFGRSRKR